MVFAGKRRCQQPHTMHPGHAAVCRHRRYFGIGLGLGRKLLNKFPDNMTELVDLLLTADVAHRPARILQILLAAHYLPDAIRHIMASGALPPAFPAIRIDGELYWDGGILSNTPVEAVF